MRIAQVADGGTQHGAPRMPARLAPILLAVALLVLAGCATPGQPESQRAVQQQVVAASAGAGEAVAGALSGDAEPRP